MTQQIDDHEFYLVNETGAFPLTREAVAALAITRFNDDNMALTQSGYVAHFLTTLHHNGAFAVGDSTVAIAWKTPSVKRHYADGTKQDKALQARIDEWIEGAAWQG